MRLKLVEVELENMIFMEHMIASFKYLHTIMGNALKDVPGTAWASAGEAEPLFVTVMRKNLLDEGEKYCNFVDKLWKCLNSKKAACYFHERKRSHNFLSLPAACFLQCGGNNYIVIPKLNTYLSK